MQAENHTPLPESRWRPPAAFVLLLLILALAAGLRFYRLDAQSFWNDEGNSARIAERSIQLILEGAAGDIHPPLYYLTLHYWRALVGYSEFALRSFSVIAGVGLVALIYTLGTWLFGRPAGLAAALLAAINPFQVYYSQEARSYIWVAFLAAAAVYCASRLQESWLNRPAYSWATGYVLAVTAGLYTHYFYPVALIAINLIVVVQFLRRKALKPLGQWLLLHLVAGILYLPWVPIALRQLTGWSSGTSQATLGPALLDIFRLLSLGITIPTAEATPALLGFGLLLLLGLVPRLPKPEPGRLLLIVLWLVLPIALIFALGIYREAFVKFVLVVSPAFCLLAGRGLALLVNARFSRGLLLPVALSLGLVLSFSYQSLHNLYFDPAYARANYRGLAQYILSVGRRGDAVITNAANQWEVLTYYYPHVDRVYPLPRSRPVREPDVVAELEQITAKHDRLFVIFWAEVESDPERVVERWLDAHAFKASNEWWQGDVRLAIYAAPALPPAEMATPLDAHFGDAIALRGFSLLAGQLAPGDIIPVTLFWQALSPVSDRYKVFLHLLDSQGALVAQRDSEPGGGLTHTSSWQPGQTQVDNHGVLIPAGTPAGEYQLVVGLYPLGDPAARLPVTVQGQPAGDALPLQPMIISQP